MYMPPNFTVRPGTWVTDQTGHIGYTLCLSLGRSTADLASLNHHFAECVPAGSTQRGRKFFRQASIPTPVPRASAAKVYGMRRQRYARGHSLHSCPGTCFTHGRPAAERRNCNNDAIASIAGSSTQNGEVRRRPSQVEAGADPADCDFS